MFEHLYKTWARLGVGFNETFTTKGLIDLEKTILETTQAGRQESRLLFGMRGWLLEHHDLVNTSRLIRFVKQEAQTAVLGALIDSILEVKPHATLMHTKKYCHKLTKEEFLFPSVALSEVQSHLNREENLGAWKRWNLISREMVAMEGAIFKKGYVLKNNLNLALRALFGPGSRAEIFSYFLNHREGNALAIARALDQSYQPIYSELLVLCQIGIAKEKKVGVARIFAIAPTSIQILLKPIVS